MYSHTEFTLSINSFFVSHNTLVKSSNFGTQDEMHFLWLQFLAFHRRAYNINLLTAKFGTKNNRYDLITIKIRFTCFKLYANYLQRNIFCNIISINHLPNKYSVTSLLRLVSTIIRNDKSHIYAN